MLAALLLALVGVGFLLLGRAWVAEANDKKAVQRLIDLAVRDQAAARRLLSEHPELREARYVHDETPLHFCAVEGMAEGVRFFASAGIPVDAKNAFGDTALMDAATLGNLEVVKLLLWHGADPNASSKTRNNALHDAVARGHAELAATLLDAGARADYVTDSGETVWDAVAKTARRDEVLKVLERHGVRR